MPDKLLKTETKQLSDLYTIELWRAESLRQAVNNRWYRHYLYVKWGTKDSVKGSETQFVTEKEKRQAMKNGIFNTFDIM
jgi:hypothetical protein